MSNRLRNIAICLAAVANHMLGFGPEGLLLGTWVAVGTGVGAVASAGSSFYGASKSGKAAKKAASTARQSAAAMERIRGQLEAGSLFGMDSREFTGSRPEFAPFERLNVSDTLQQNAQANVQALPDIAAQTFGANDINQLSNQVRFERLFPGGLEALKSQGQAAASLSKGELPFEDALKVVRDRGALSNSLGLGGTQFASAVPRDLGLSRLQAIQSGAALTAQGANTASAISPVGSQLLAQQNMFSGAQGVDLGLRQNLLQQQSQQNQYNLAASPDPLAQNLLGLELQRLQMRTSGQLAASQIEGANALASAKSIGSGFEAFGSGLGNLYKAFNQEKVPDPSGLTAKG